VNWTTIAELGTALGTLVLAFATFASVRSGNRTARLSERSLLEGIRPLLLPSRLQDLEQKVGFADDHWILLPGGHGAAEIGDDAIYLAIAIRNVGSGLAVLSGWKMYPDRANLGSDRPQLEGFHRLTRDLYIPSNDVGFWQGTFRDPADDGQKRAAEIITAREAFTIDVLYGDAEGGQRVVTRFSMLPAKNAKDGWIVAVSRHWNLDREDPRARQDIMNAERD
jgi:hypothetical protein